MISACYDYMVIIKKCRNKCKVFTIQNVMAEKLCYMISIQDLKKTFRNVPIQISINMLASSLSKHFV